MSTCRSEWYEWDGTVSRIITLGHGIVDSHVNLDRKELFIIVPGNPGQAGFYEPFMESLHNRVGNPELSIWSVSHAGHDSDSSAWIPKEKTYDFEQQILHKLHILEQLVPTSTRITFIGHSIGCKIIMEIFRQNSTHSLSGSYFLFPTIEGMLSTERGKQTYPLTTTFRIPFILLASLLNMILPGKLMHLLIGLVKREAPSKVRNAIRHLINPNHVNNSLVMAKQELDTVHELDTDTLESMGGRLRVYYGMNDGWCPLIFRNNLLKVEGILEEDAVVDEHGMEHAFVLGSSSGTHLGSIIGDWTKVTWRT